jgi:CDP-6-deoxy-D-xylo-4-hexulose-3-dehydrase
MTSRPQEPPEAAALRAKILELVAEYARVAHGPLGPCARRPFLPHAPSVPVSGKTYGAEELVALADAALEFDLTAGRYNELFERALAAHVGVRRAMTCNSGSSANLLAVSALCSPELGADALQPGDEVLTCATGFPTTVNPILQNGLVPVLVDVRLPTYDVDPQALADAIGPRTRAIVLAHTLGNPFDVDAVVALARARGLRLVEDACDALGSLWRGRPVGASGDLATLSFYPAHHITTGEGGAVLVERPQLARIVESLRDWGRDCWCAPGRENTCGKRFGWQLGQLPAGYDHKYVYSHAGYNLKMTDLQAAIGYAQTARLAAFGEARRRNFAHLRDGLKDLEELLVLPEAHPHADPSWFGFPITLRECAPFERVDVVRHLESKGVATRQVMGGNLARQPYFAHATHRVHGALEESDRVMQRSCWVGVFPALEPAHVAHTLEVLRGFLRGERPRGALRALP